MSGFFEEILGPKISRERFEQIRSDEIARRIHFPTTHSTALKRSEGEKWYGSFSVPFWESVGLVFEQQTGLELFRSKYGYWRSIRDESEYEAIADWIESQRNRVFLRDCLDASIALSFNFMEKAERRYTKLGKLEHDAKYQQDESAVRKLAGICVRVIRSLPSYKDATHISAVPPRPDKGFDLPSSIAGQVAQALSMIDVTSLYEWSGDKGSLKEAADAEKWDQLEAAGLNFVGGDLSGTRVILIDDLYQSGQTMQFVASRLAEANAGEILGLALVKSWRDTDNQ
ncbi:phosphoribosyltransferase [Pelagibius sp.]|uniref:phosphoribosyltransferase n=1 Tax=Pelagibius sp. TaxID=1931238 RepID=UPI00261E65E5|nr:hypothetical protein [Pelagibius sp.]